MEAKKLRLLHYPQIQCKPFIVRVKDLEEARKIADTLAFYDQFQFENKIKPDYCNTTILEEWDEQVEGWIDWCDEETGIMDLDEYFDFLNEE